MMLPKLTLLAAFCVCATQAVLNGNEVKRREGFDTYGPPRPAPQYGPPPQRVPHREYGVPQQIPFREYGPPSLKYGPPKLNFLGGSSSSSSSSSSFGGGLHEQIKSHFGVPKPFYGPPHIQHKPAPQYGPPQQPAPQYGPPKPAYGPPPALKPVYGPPAKQQHRPQPNYGPPKPQYGPPPPLPQALPSPHPAPLFQSSHQPATSYGPPPSGPLNFPIKPNYDAPPPNYGPPPLPISLPGPQPANFNHPPETTIIVSSGGHGGPQLPPQDGPAKQVQIQIDSSGHTHSVSGSQAPFHTACDGWKPIPAPIGAYVEHNNIETQSGYSNVAQGAAISNSFGTQYSGGAGIGGGIISSGGGNSIVEGLTDEQLVTIALQGGFDNGNSVGGSGNVGPTGPAGNIHLNSIESEALQLSLGSPDDSYSKPPLDSFAPGSGHAQKYNTISTGPGLPPPGGNYGPPPPNGNYGPPPPPPSGNYRPPPPSGNYGPPPSGSYGPPPNGNYGPPSGPGIAAALIQEQHQQHQQQQQHIHNVASSSSAASAGLSLQYGVPSGNAHAFPPHNGPQPNRPVAYRPPVPQGLLESIGAAVQHLDQFGVKPQQQPPTYIPPAANEIAQSGPELPPSPEYGTPQNVPPAIIEQQLPQPQPAQIFVHQQQQQQQQNFQQQQQHQQQQQQQQQHQQHILQQQQNGNVHNQYGPPPPPPQSQYFPPIPHVRPLGPPPPSPNQQYLPPPQQQAIFLQQQQHENHNAESAYSASQHSHQFVHTQGLPLPLQEPRFNGQSQQQQQVHIHDCGQGPNLVGGVGYQVSGGANVGSSYQIANSATVGTSAAYNAIAQSIPVAEQHTQFLAGPDDSYGPPPSGNINDIDHLGYASQKSSVTALPDGTDPQNLPGLDGLNVISAQKSQSIQLNSDQVNTQPKQTFQVQFGVSPNNQNNNGGHDGAPGPNGEQSANHEEILSQDLLQSILTAIEQPQQHPQQHQSELPYNHKAQSRSDINLHDDATEDDTDAETETETDTDTEPNVEESQKVEVRALPDHINTDDEDDAVVKEIKPIVAEDVEAKI